jgi:hypothetical protein
LWQIRWQLALGRTATEVTKVIGRQVSWFGQIAKGYTLYL